MHFRNGRPAKNGDKVVFIPEYGSPVAGILYDATPGNDSCNGRIAATSGSDPMPDLRYVLHIDDIAKASVPDSTIVVAEPAPAQPIAQS